MSSTDSPVRNTHDPFSRRILIALGWSAAYGILWYFWWRPLPPHEWVNVAIIVAILFGTLPPDRIRNFTAALGYIAIAVPLQLIFHQTLAAVVLTLLGALAAYNGVSYLQQSRARR